PAGRARVALAAAFGQVPDWQDSAKPRPAPTDYAARQENQATWLRSHAMRLGYDARAAAEARFGGSPAFNTGVPHPHLFERAPQRDLVEALYAKAGLSVEADLRAVDDAPRVAADPRALAELRRLAVFDGALAAPVLTLHVTGAEGVPVGAERAYADVVR